ncbi:MAG: DUF3747 domain-containing protein [Geitlerinemataceae cyanobacterium]
MNTIARLIADKFSGQLSGQPSQKLPKKVQLATFSATLLGATLLGSIAPANAALFGQEEVRQRDFVAISAPVGTTIRRSLLIVEQKASTRPCWSESGSAPTVVEPLLLDFDFTGICGRATDSNAYSVRVGGEDLGVGYTLSLVRSGDEMLLMANPFRGDGPRLEIGRAGYTDDFSKVQLNPGWRFTKRTYQGRTLGHIYLTHDSTLAELAETNTDVAIDPAPPAPTPSPIALPEPPGVDSAPVADDPNMDWRDRLELTDNQRVAINRIHQDYLEERDRQEIALAEARNTLQDQIFAGENRQARRSRSTIRKIHRSLADLYYSSLSDMRDVMDDEQQVEFAELITRRSTVESDEPLLTGMVR